MSLELIITLVALGVSVISGIVGIVVAIVRGDMKKFIIEKMEEAEHLYANVKKDKSKLKLNYVIESVKEKYKVLQLVLNVKKFIEHIIDLSKEINAK